jgi:glycosyltransferase involved in cell wall biosynthesis
MLSIGFITGNHYPRLGGMEMAVHHLAVALDHSSEVAVSVACATMPEIPNSFQYPYPCYRSKSFSILTPYLFKQNQNRMIQEEKPHLLHGPMLHGGGYWSMLLAEEFDLPFVAQSHGSDVQIIEEIGYGACLDEQLKKKVQEVIRRADKLIAVSSLNKQNMIDLGARPESIVVIPNGIHFEEIQAIPAKNIRDKLGFKEDDFVLITVGRNRPVKRMDLLFQALSHLKDFRAIKCVCVGPKENLPALAEKYNINDKVTFTGRIPEKSVVGENPPYADLINLYRSTNLYVSTSFVESFGNAAADALACGIPIIVGKKHGVRDVITENESGWVMEQETPKELAEMILDRYNQRALLIENHSKIVASVSGLTWQNIAEETIQAYKDVLRN